MADPEIKIFKHAQDMRAFTREQRRSGKTIGLVPTMGYLHEGHLTLVKAAQQACDIVIVSIYVNPTQFSKTEDFGVYPRNLEADLEKLRTTRCVAVFNPDTLYHGSHGSSNTTSNGGNGNAAIDAAMVVGAEEVKDRDTHSTWVEVEGLTNALCATSRPHHFKGVTTVVTKLFNIVEPDLAFFGQKDYQQWRVICRMARDLDFPIEIIGVPIIREADGLAMSSRNSLLTPENRAAAPCIHAALCKARDAVTAGEIQITEDIKARVAAAIEAGGGRVDYVEVIVAETLEKVERVGDRTMVVAIAAYFGNVRLIDNIEIEPPSSL